MFNDLSNYQFFVFWAPFRHRSYLLVWLEFGTMGMPKMITTRPCLKHSQFPIEGSIFCETVTWRDMMGLIVWHMKWACVQQWGILENTSWSCGKWIFVIWYTFILSFPEIALGWNCSIFISACDDFHVCFPWKWKKSQMWLNLKFK